MAVFDAPKTTYSDTGPDVRVISNIIQLIDPTDTPLLDALGGLDRAKSMFRLNVNGTKIEWPEDSLDALSGSVASATIATNATNFTVTDASIFRVGHEIKIDSELMVVKAVDVTNNTVTVYARDWGGTNATHTSTATIEIIGMARMEGADAQYSAMTSLSIPYNYTAIFQDGIKLTGTMMAVDQYGIDNQYEYQALKKMPRLLQLVERKVFEGIRNAGSATVPRSFGGLGTFITNNTTAASGALTKAHLNTVMSAIFSDTSQVPDYLVCDPGAADDLYGIIEAKVTVFNDYSTSGIGNVPVRVINTNWGQLRVLVSRWCPPTTAYLLNSKKIGLHTLRPFAWEKRPKTGDFEAGEVIGELSLVVANDACHGKITAIS